MSQLKSKNKLKGEPDQPSITTFYQAPKGQRISNRRSHSLSAKRKRNSPTSPRFDSPKKRIIREADNNMQEDPDELKQQDDGAESETSNLDKGILIAIERLLKPIRDNIRDLLSTQRKLKDELILSKHLECENKKLTSRIEVVGKENQELTCRVTNLENKMLESNLIFSGIKEEPSEMDLMRQEKVYLAISETIIGRTLEERINTAKSMLIKELDK